MTDNRIEAKVTEPASIQPQSSQAAWILRSVPVSSFNDGRRGLPHEEQDCAEPIRGVPAGAV